MSTNSPPPDQQSLLRAYAELGKHVFSSKQLRARFPEHFTSLDKCVAAKSQTPSDNVDARKAIDRKILSGCAGLGEAAYKTMRADAGPPELVQRIESLLVGSAVKASPASAANGLKEGATVLGQSAQLAGGLAVKQAERTKIHSIQLPNAYAALGKVLFESGEQVPGVAGYFTQLTTLSTQLQTLLDSFPKQADKGSLTEKAAVLAKQAAATASKTALERQIRQQLAALGKHAYETDSVQSRFPSEHAQIAGLISRDGELGKAIGALQENFAETGAQAQQIAVAAAKKGYSMLMTSATVITFAVAPLSWLPIWKHPRWGRLTKITLALLSLVCTAGLFTVGRAKSASASKAVAAANEVWESGNQRDAIVSYKELLADSAFIEKADLARIYRRVIEFDASHDNAESGRRLIAEADRRGLQLSLDDPQATAMLAEYQQDKLRKAREQEADRAKAEESRKAKEGPRTGKPASGQQVLSVKKALLGGRIDLCNLISDEVDVSDPAMSDGRLTFKLRWNNDLSGGRLWRYVVYGKQGERLGTDTLDVSAMRLGETARVEIYLRSEIRGEAARIDLVR